MPRFRTCSTSSSPATWSLSSPASTASRTRIDSVPGCVEDHPHPRPAPGRGAFSWSPRRRRSLPSPTKTPHRRAERTSRPPARQSRAGAERSEGSLDGREHGGSLALARGRRTALAHCSALATASSAAAPAAGDAVRPKTLRSLRAGVRCKHGDAQRRRALQGAGASERNPRHAGRGERYAERGRREETDGARGVNGASPSGLGADLVLGRVGAHGPALPRHH